MPATPMDALAGSLPSRSPHNPKGVPTTITVSNATASRIASPSEDEGLHTVGSLSSSDGKILISNLCNRAATKRPHTPPAITRPQQF
jgi:hypothetical protein